MSHIKEWVIDITFGDNPICFIPYERETEMFVTGMNVISTKCPGKLVGVIHLDEPEIAEEWIKNNPDWQKIYS